MVSNEEIKRRLNDKRVSEKHCPNCGMKYDETAKFCRICGSSLVFTVSHNNQIDIPNSKYCPNCNIGFKESARFCRICGSSLISAISHNRQTEESNIQTNNSTTLNNHKYCPNCNVGFKENAEFCNNCGSSLIYIDPQTQKSNLKQPTSKVIPQSTTSIAPQKSNLKQTSKVIPKPTTSIAPHKRQTGKSLEHVEKRFDDSYKTKSFERYENEYIIDIKNLKKSYNKTNVLNGINLKIKKGEFVSIIGPSGSGKSTLLNMIGALDKADGGAINVAGLDLMLNDDLSDFRSKEIGFVFQLHNLIPNLTVVENVEIPMFENDYSAEYMRRRAVELLEAVGLADKLYQIPNELSGGQMQRVAIARALVNHPSIILADEPTGSLDSKTGDVILELMKDIHKKENVTLIMVTHAPYVANMADRVISVLDGEIKKDYIP